MDRNANLEKVLHGSKSQQDKEKKYSEYGKNVLNDFLIDIITNNKESATAQNPLLETGRTLTYFAFGTSIALGLLAYGGKIDYSNPIQVTLGAVALTASMFAGYVAAKIFTGGYSHLYDQRTKTTLSELVKKKTPT
jgi:hypothetical protein